MDNTSVKALTDRQECSEAIQHLVDTAEQHIAIFSQQLEPLLYNHQSICDTLSSLARKNRNTTIRIIAQQTRSAAADGHCLVHLAQRLSSFIQIRIPDTAELQRFAQSWLITDNHSICEIANPETYDGKLIEHDRLHVRTQLEFFNHAWEHSLPDVHTRRLNI